MRDIFDNDVQTVTLACSECGTPVELAPGALSVFESEDRVLCVECLVRVGDTPRPTMLTLEDRVALIDDVIDDFSARLRTILLRSVRPDLSWNSDFHFDEWPDPADSQVAAHAPGIWYAGKDDALRRRRLNN